MKKTVLALALIVASSTFAQSNTTTGSVSPSDNALKGMYVGASYMNLTDVHMKSTIKSSYGDFSGSSVGGTHLGLAGISLGYNQTPERGIGFSAGAQLLESFNSSEYGDQKLDIIIPEANLTLAANKNFFAFLGLNASVWTGSTIANKYKTQLGAQSGIAVRFNKELMMSAGYTMMNQKISESDVYGSSEMEIQASGLNSSLTYTF